METCFQLKGIGGCVEAERLGARRDRGWFRLRDCSALGGVFCCGRNCSSALPTSEIAME